MKKLQWIRALLVLIVPTLFALLMRGFFASHLLNKWYPVMSMSFLFLVPFAMGAMLVFALPAKLARLFRYRFCAPWIPVLLFMGITILLNIEGWACWLMALPLFLLAASVGGMTAGYIRTRRAVSQKLSVSLIVLLPLLASPVEHLVGSRQHVYTAYTSIDIQATGTDIWKNVTRVREIPQEQDSGWFSRTLGLPRPISAELNYEGVGAHRKAIFDKGLVFDETVTQYMPEKEMTFTIAADPYNIPSTTMDEHIVIGGAYFDVLTGTYTLQPLSHDRYRLHLSSRFVLMTSFNGYASWWATWIMKDIQQNILKVIRQRAEENYGQEARRNQPSVFAARIDIRLGKRFFSICMREDGKAIVIKGIGSQYTESLKIESADTSAVFTLDSSKVYFRKLNHLDSLQVFEANVSDGPRIEIYYNKQKVADTYYWRAPIWDLVRLIMFTLPRGYNPFRADDKPFWF